MKFSDLTPSKNPKAGSSEGGGFSDLPKLNGPGNVTSKQLLQIIPINVIAIITIIGAAVGLYWKFDARITALENNPRFGMTAEEKATLINRVAESERELRELNPKIIETHTHVLWLMNQQRGAHPDR
jgi:hypothetical protein